MQNINEIDELIKIISRLPGLGPKSAKRIILKLINNRDELMKPMTKVLSDVYKNISRCNLCGSLKSNNICDNCNLSNKKSNKICVVENIADQWSIESSNIFDGYFHILGGTIHSSGQRKEDLLINALVNINDREKHIIMVRRLTDEPKTLEELSNVYNISRERVRQIEVRAFEKLQKTVRSQAVEQRII